MRFCTRSLLCLAGIAGSVAASAQNVYVLVTGSNFHPHAVNNDLMIVGDFTGGSSGGFAWTPGGGMIQRIGMFFADVNQSGVVAGGDGGYGMRWTIAGGPEHVSILPGYPYMGINGINDLNQIVGWCGPHAVQADTNTTYIIGPGDLDVRISRKINASGVVLGISSGTGVPGNLWVWSPLTGVTYIPYVGPSSGSVSDINNSTQVTGADHFGGVNCAFIWSPATGTVHYPAAANFLSINSQGHTAGILYNFNGACLFDGSSFKNLTDIVGVDYSLSTADALNDLDEVVGMGRFPDGQEFVYVITNRQLNLAKVPAGAFPNSLTVQRGILVSGNADALARNDELRLNVRNGPVLSGAEAPVTVILNATSPYQSVSNMTLRVDAQASFVTLEQKVDMWDYTASAWVTVDARQSTTTDSQFTVVLSNPNRFIEAGTKAMRARVRYKPNGPVLNNVWQGRIDFLKWSVRE